MPLSTRFEVTRLQRRTETGCADDCRSVRAADVTLASRQHVTLQQTLPVAMVDRCPGDPAVRVAA